MDNEHDCGCNKCCPGERGPVGMQGPQGPQGVEGHQGVPGLNGINGVDGSVGAVGPAGSAGPQGATGPQGTTGPQGPAGLNGANGNDGAVGPAGLQGAVGPQGPAGPQGQAGVQGPIGPQGVHGVAGPVGQTGSQGPMGPVGPMGMQGEIGPKGDCIECPCNCEAGEFAEAYSILPQQLAASPGPNLAGDVVLLENTIVASPNLDLSLAATQGKFIVNVAGWYDVAAGMTGTLNPIPAPLPVWTLSLFLNGVIVPGSTFSNVPLSPAQASNEITADTFVYCNVGDELTLANTSSAAVFLSAPILGTNAQTNSAYMKIILLRKGAK